MDYNENNHYDTDSEGNGTYSSSSRQDTVEAGSFRVEDTYKPPKKKGGAKKAVALVLACALVGGGSGVGGAALFDALSGGNTSTTIYEGNSTAAVAVANIETGSEMTAAQIYAAYVDSTVGITVDVTSTNIFGMTSTGVASGSGFIISQDGYIVTNYHVVEGGATVTVTLNDGTAYSAAIVGYDEDHDVAVLKVEADGLTPVVLGNSDNLYVGDSVVAIGNPLGELTFSLTSGVISALNRSVTLSTAVTMNLLQTDCAINSGNSGGALFNSYGEVVGITNAKYSSSSSTSTASIDNIAFAIPINQVKDIITQLIENGFVTKPYLGITVVTVSETDAQRYNLVEGAYVNAVTSGSCAETAGLQQGDVITAVNDIAVASAAELISAKNNYAPGDTITLTVNRNGEELKLDVTLDEQTGDTTTEETTTASTDQNQNSAGGQQQQSSPYYFNWGF